MPADEDKEKLLGMAKAYLELTKDLVSILESTLDDMQMRAQGDEPVTDADKAVIKVVKQISEAMTNARKHTED